MTDSSDYIVVNMIDVLKIGNIEIVQNDISSFTSSNNNDVENFLKNNSVDFCRLKQAITYLVYERKNSMLSAYFTLALKIMEFQTDALSNSMLKVLERNGNRDGNLVQVPGILLAQWSKNFSFENCISGKTMLEFVKNELLKAQHQIGGSFLFLECEAEKNRLVEHYKTMGFSAVSERMSNANIPLIQFIKKV